MAGALRENRSVWAAQPKTHYPQLHGTERADVAVVGGGITGLTTALLVARTGARVALLEALKIGTGVTGYSTAKVTSLHGLAYSRIAARFGTEGARRYGEANQAGIERLASLVTEHGIECLFQRQPAYTYTCDPALLNRIQREVHAALTAGLPASFAERSELPFPIRGAVRFENQAQLDPYRYCVGLARAFTDSAGGRIFEESRAVWIETGKDARCSVRTTQGTIEAERIVLATLLPFADPGVFFARTHPERSYGLCVELDGPVPGGMHLSAEQPTRSVRPMGEGQRVIVVGESHKVGQSPDTRKHYQALESWCRRVFPVRAVVHRWSAQDYMPSDGVPFIGWMPFTSKRILVATGFQKWGLSTGTAAAMIFSDLLQGRPNPWASLFDPGRLDFLRSPRSFLIENLNVGKRFLADRLKSVFAPAVEKLPSGQAAVVRCRGGKAAAYRDEAGVLHAVAPACTHMGCRLTWNTAEGAPGPAVVTGRRDWIPAFAGRTEIMRHMGRDDEL
ncbi:MAG: FAD-dependent oxidoreductase [bacterium]